MMRAKCVAAAALLLTSVSALAVETTYSFDSVTKVSYGPGPSGTKITGVLVNDTVPTTTTAATGTDAVHVRCADLTRDMLRNPGMYILNVTVNVVVYTDPSPGTSTTLTNCSLEVKP